MNYILKKFECFDDVGEDNSYLAVTNNSSLYYIATEESNYVAWEKYDLTIMPLGCDITHKKSYYDVISGKNVLNLIQSLNFNDVICLNNAKIIPLSRIYRVKTGEKRYLTLNDVKSLLEFEKKQIVKKKTLDKGKHVF